MSGDVGAEVAAVLADALRGRCLNCLRVMATDEDWETTVEGERPDLCWEANVYSCGWVAETTREALQAAALAPLIAVRVEAAKAEAWDEGALRIADLLGCGFDNDHLTRLNPYRAEATP